MVRDTGHRDPARPQEGEALGLVVGCEPERAVGALDVEHRARDRAPEGQRAGARERAPDRSSGAAGRTSIRARRPRARLPCSAMCRATAGEKRGKRSREPARGLVEREGPAIARPPGARGRGSRTRKRCGTAWSSMSGGPRASTRTSAGTRVGLERPRSSSRSSRPSSAPPAPRGRRAHAARTPDRRSSRRSGSSRRCRPIRSRRGRASRGRRRGSRRRRAAARPDPRCGRARGSRAAGGGAAPRSPHSIR